MNNLWGLYWPVFFHVFCQKLFRRWTAGNLFLWARRSSHYGRQVNRVNIKMFFRLVIQFTVVRWNLTRSWVSRYVSLLRSQQIVESDVLAPDDIWQNTSTSQISEWATALNLDFWGKKGWPYHTNILSAYISTMWLWEQEFREKEFRKKNWIIANQI